MGRFEQLPQPLRSVVGIRATLLDRLLTHTANQVNGVYWTNATVAFDGTHVASDGFHPNAEAMQIGARLIADTLGEDMFQS